MRSTAKNQKNCKYIILLTSMLWVCCTKEYRVIPDTFVYSIVQKQDTIYYSTNSTGIYKFPLKIPEQHSDVLKLKGIPVRSFLFTPNDSIYALSYTRGLFIADRGTVRSFLPHEIPGWSMVYDDSGNIWVAGLHGVYRVAHDRITKYSSDFDIHDIAVHDNRVYLATYHGIHVHDLKTGAFVDELYAGINFWRIRMTGDTLIAGGKDVCVFKYDNSIRTITLNHAGNIIWDFAIDKKGVLFFATEFGLYRCKPDEAVAQCIAFKGKCIKSVFIDSSGQLWVGKYFKC
jgi:hypothetical protein